MLLLIGRMRPCADQFTCSLCHGCGARARRKERSADADPCRARRDPLAKIRSARAADGPYADVTGQHVSQRSQMCSSERARREQLEMPCPGSQRGNASVAVITPGSDSSPCCSARSTTARSMFGETIRRPPAAATSRTCAGLSTVPAPMSACSPNLAARRSMLSSGCGEFSGTSMMRIPQSRSAAPISNAISGCTPAQYCDDTGCARHRGIRSRSLAGS